jgi:hypothetical protein
LFGLGRNGILQVEKDLVGGQVLGFVDHLLAAARHGKTRSAGLIRHVHASLLPFEP